jgi:hypothetical protein
VAAAKLAGVDVLLEPSSIMLHSNDRPDLALRDPHGCIRMIADVRTASVSVYGTCRGAAATSGHAAACGATLKDTKWLSQAIAQGLTHFSLVAEDGGALGPTIANFIALLASKAGGSSTERDAFTIFVTQHIRAVSMRGVSDILVSRFPAGAIPRAPRRSLLPLAQPKPRPATTRLLQMPRSQSVVAPWQLAALPIPPGPFTSPLLFLDGPRAGRNPTPRPPPVSASGDQPNCPPHIN